MLLTVKARCFVGVVAFAVAVSGCGKDSPSAPTNTPPPTPTVTGLSIGGSADRLRTRQTQALTATVTLSNGATQAATSPSWSSSNATVASVSDGGVVTGNNQGNATISVTAQGQTATRRYRSGRTIRAHGQACTGFECARRPGPSVARLGGVRQTDSARGNCFQSDSHWPSRMDRPSAAASSSGTSWARSREPCTTLVTSSVPVPRRS